MKVYRIFDKIDNKFLKLGKKTNDIYVNKNLMISILKKKFNIDDVQERFDIIEYELVRIKKGGY